MQEAMKERNELHCIRLKVVSLLFISYLNSAFVSLIVMLSRFYVFSYIFKEIYISSSFLFRKLEFQRFYYASNDCCGKKGEKSILLSRNSKNNVVDLGRRGRGKESFTGLDCYESGELASKTRYREVNVSICTKPRTHEEEVRVARAARFYRFRASACSRAAANCSLMQANERASGRVAFLGRVARKASFDDVNDENAT